MDMSLSKLRELVKDREARRASVPGVTKSWCDMMEGLNWTELNSNQESSFCVSFSLSLWEISKQIPEISILILTQLYRIPKAVV